MDLKKLEMEAKKAALIEIKNMFQKPSQLEKLDQYKQRIERKKASTEALLKSNMQNQLEGVTVGLRQLKHCLSDVRDVGIKMNDVNSILEYIPKIYVTLDPIREEYINFSQYGTALEYMTNISNIEAKVQETLQFIEDDKLLDAHQCLVELENSRDDLLYELHIQPERYAETSDNITLKKYFVKVDTITERLEEKIRLILRRTLNIVRVEPTMIVTALRIIEREEKSDQLALQQQKYNGFLPPGRPKRWRKMTMDVLTTSVIDRIEGSKLEDRTDKYWLVKDLEITRQLILEDLHIIKSLCVPCFPPHYDIFNEFIKIYHKILADYLNRIIMSGLDGNEYLTFLSWVMNTYNGPELMLHPDLQIDVYKIAGPLLKPDQLNILQDEYLEIIEKNYQEWMTNILEKEKEEWFSEITEEKMFQEEYGDFYQTSGPSILFQMIKEHLELTNTINTDITFNALLLSMRQMEIFGQNYLSNITDYKNQHFKNRRYQTQYFQDHIIATINNNRQIIELARHLKELYWPKSQAKHYENFKRLIKTFQKNYEVATLYLLEEIFFDVENNFNELFTSKWLQDRTLIKTICKTLDTSFAKFIHLQSKNFEFVINEAQTMITKQYVKALLSKRLSKSSNDIELITNNINIDASEMKIFFDEIIRIASDLTINETPIDLITTLSNLLICDIELLVLDLTTLLGNYPSLSEEQILRLFYIRNDVKSAEIKEKFKDAMRTKKSLITTANYDNIFKEIVFNDKLW